MPHSIEQRARNAGVIPVIVVDQLATALPMAAALIEGGLDVLEITLRSSTALAAIEQVAQAFPNACVGAGTVLNAEQAKACQDAGAQFAVSPGLTENLAHSAQALNLPLLPGVANAGDIMRARDLGYHFLKFFPASILGGAGAIKAYGGPFPDVVFCPTGGISLDNAPQYLSLPNVACVGGSWVLPRSALAEGNYDEISTLASAAHALRSV